MLLHRSGRKKTGYVLLVAMIVLGTVGVAIGVSLVLTGIASTRNSVTVSESARAMAQADACAEKALDEIRLNAAYAGNESIQFSPGDCSIGTVSESGGVYTIQATGTLNTVVRRVAVSAQRLTVPVDAMQIQTWQEVANF